MALPLRSFHTFDLKKIYIRNEFTIETQSKMKLDSMFEDIYFFANSSYFMTLGEIEL
jgi:NhaP-type Na+/H+ or K+/H+ antiporter